MIKIFNKRDPGHLFHYAHFICDCLFPEIINGIYKHSIVVREESIDQTLGIFTPIYEEVTQMKNLEMNPDEYTKIELEQTVYPSKWAYTDKANIDLFRNYIFKRYEIEPIIFNSKYPEVLLIKRGHPHKLINNQGLISNINNWSISNGAERREIFRIDALESHLHKKIRIKIQSRCSRKCAVQRTDPIF